MNKDFELSCYEYITKEMKADNLKETNYYNPRFLIYDKSYKCINKFDLFLGGKGLIKKFMPDNKLPYFIMDFNSLISKENLLYLSQLIECEIAGFKIIIIPDIKDLSQMFRVRIEQNNNFLGLKPLKLISKFHNP